MQKLKAGRKTERIVVRCTPELYRRWKMFLLDCRGRFRTSGDALEYLLDLLAERIAEEERRRVVRSY
jgi:hypothetical protein